MRRIGKEEGIALALAMLLAIILIALGGAILGTTLQNHTVSKEHLSQARAFHGSEDGLQISLDLLNSYALDASLEEPEYFNSTAEAPHYVRAALDDTGSAYVIMEIRDDGIAGNTGTPEDTKIIRASGYRGGYLKTVEITVRNTSDLHDVFANAIYAGNSSGTEGYTLNLGGEDDRADIVTGSVFADGGIRFDGDSWAEFIAPRVEGDDIEVAGRTIDTRIHDDRAARATDDVTMEDDGGDASRAQGGASGQDAPITRADIDALLEAYADHVVDVRQEFAEHEMPASSAPSGCFSSSTHRTNYWNYYRDYVIADTANPAHIFTHGAQRTTASASGYTGTADPTMASPMVSSTTPPAALTEANKGYNTYHLKDPFTTASSGRAAATGYEVTLTGDGTDGAAAGEGNMKIYYIEGDLWIHDPNAYDINLSHGAAEGMKIAFIVKGNIYFSDNVLWNNAAGDLFLFLAIKREDDPEGEQSGNISLGDPQFGTVEELDCMLYAENNFIENNITAGGSAEFCINGNMTAGNLVSINRDDGDIHSKMVVNYESRVTNDAGFREQMPAWMQTLLYRSESAAARHFEIVAWRQDNSLALSESDPASVTLEREAVVAEIAAHNADVGE